MGKLGLTVTVLVLLMSVFTSTCFAETDMKDTCKTGIIGAMDEEVNSLKEALDEKRVSTIAGMEFCEGKLDGADVVVVKCSVGKVNAAACTQILIDRFGTDIIMAPHDKEHFHTSVMVTVSPQFFGWLAGIGKGIRIQWPEDVRGQYREYLQGIIDNL